MKNKNIDFLKERIVELHKIVAELNKRFSIKHFTLDGRLVGDIGEIIAEQVYDIKLYEGLKKYYDGETSDNKKVQIKVTFKEHLTFNHCPDYYLGLKLNEKGEYIEIYNEPGTIIKDRFKHRKGIGTQLFSFPINQLEELSKKVEEKDKIKKRQG